MSEHSYRVCDSIKVKTSAIALFVRICRSLSSLFISHVPRSSTCHISCFYWNNTCNLVRGTNNWYLVTIVQVVYAVYLSHRWGTLVRGGRGAVILNDLSNVIRGWVNYRTGRYWVGFIDFLLSKLAKHCPMIEFLAGWVRAGAALPLADE